MPLQQQNAPQINGNISNNGGKRKDATPSDDEGAANGDKGKRKKKPKKEKDPDAPKRPMSAYLIFQNSVREDMKAKNPTLNYRELITAVGDSWKNMGDTGQAVSSTCTICIAHT